MLRRPALGETASLGQLYDARSDTFTALSVLNEPLPKRAIKKVKPRSTSTTSTRYGCTDEISGKFRLLGIDDSLGASYLAGSVSAYGASRHLLSGRESNLCAQASLVYNVNTIKDTFHFESKYINLHNLESTEATHVVSEVWWGSSTVVTIEQDVSSKEDAKQVSEILTKEIALLGDQLSLPKNGHGTSSTQAFGNSYRVWLFSDVDTVVPRKPTTMSDAIERLARVPAGTEKFNGGKVKQLQYVLLPVTEVCRLLKCQVPRGLTTANISPALFQRLLHVFEQVERDRGDCCDYLRLLKGHKPLVSPTYLECVIAQMEEASSGANCQRGDFGRLLKDVRCGAADESALLEAAEHFGHKFSVAHTFNTHERTWYTEKIQFVQDLLDKGAEYAGFQRQSFDGVLGQPRDVDVYVFLLSKKARNNFNNLYEQISLAHKLLEDYSPGARLVIKDCDAFSEPLPEARIALFRNGEEIISDVYQDRKLYSKVCRARYTGAKPENSAAPRPLSATLVAMPCPNSLCEDTPRDWICAECGCQIEYERSDQFIYCGCGRGNYRHWSFRCCDERHGYDFTCYQDGKLLGLLNALKVPEAINILILGQTGVGKSTWINAFVNYLQLPTLDEALQENQPFQWIIPFAFEVNNVNDKGEYEAVKVKVGFDKMEQAAPNSVVAEKDGISGASSTQITAVHRVKDGKGIIRLIDTPGIGDTEGTESDKKNMADILCVLRSYKDIHGILILLKPNDQKLNLMFKFCIQELLTNLHRDAARNIAFGFTNTRGTNYKPGDTFGPLNELLSQHKDTVDIPLNQSHVYCFDSESFRFLAAQKTCNQTIGNLDENRTSWDKSVEESRRLINYFQGLTPHNVRSTVNLYETRYRIVNLTKPMAEIAAAIEATIRINDDEIRDLQESNSLKVNLEKSLRTRVLKPTAVRVEMPLTTCSDKACVTYLDSGTKGLDGRAILTTNYKSKCHSPCYLEGVALENIGDAALRSCWAMNRGEFCRQCGHVWNSHLHINYELKYIYEEVNNPRIEEQLQKNADIQAQKEASIALKTRQISELEAELAKIRDTAAQFSVFLRANAILPYNDATLEYLQRQIDEESAKVAFGGSRDKLDNLTSYHQQYKQQVDILEKSRHQKQHQMLFDQLGVETALAELQSLKIYGAMLRNLEEAIRSSEESASREKGLLMRAKTNWGAKPRKPVQSHVKSLSTSPEDRVSLSNISPLSQAADGTPTSRTAQTGSLTPENIDMPTTALDKKPEKPRSWRRSISKKIWGFWNLENDP